MKNSIYKYASLLVAAYLLEGCRQVVIDENKGMLLRCMLGLVYIWGLTALIFSHLTNKK